MSYRHPRYHNQKTLLEPYEAMGVFFGLIGLAVVALAIAGAANSAPIHAVEPNTPLERLN